MAFMTHLQEFLMELGNGFIFDSRQKRILIEDYEYKVDIVFYNRLLLPPAHNQLFRAPC